MKNHLDMLSNSGSIREWKKSRVVEFGGTLKGHAPT